MKTLAILFALLFALPVMAIGRGQLDQLLLEKGTTIANFERNGARLLMGGEVTGGGRSVQFASVEVIFTTDEAILKNEIQFVNSNGPSMSHVNSIQASGRQIEKSQIIGVITK